MEHKSFYGLVLAKDYKDMINTFPLTAALIYELENSENNNETWMHGQSSNG